jgi:Protein of unknown function (DUF1592)/Protein of unknown function (DUF1588)/Protein of unknown function (DUF1595)/Protein of unknown function (DUF1585)/Protein of unknown function (DUF1587)
MRKTALWSVPLSLWLAAGCLGNIGDSGQPTGESTDGLCADTPFVRRLTVPEYVATVKATLDVDIEAEAIEQLPPDLRADGFSNTAGSLIVTLDHAEAYDELAALAVERIADLPAFIEAHASCSDMTDACQVELIDALGARLFRAPIDPVEREQLLGIFDTAETEGEGFEVATVWLLRAMLQSPRFLYRVEGETGDGTRALNGYELATRLSYLLWSASPDAPLAQAAAGDALKSDEAIVAQVRRMLDDDRAKTTARRYLRDWLNLDRLDNLQRDATEFPEWDEQLARDMKDETIAYFEHLVWEQERPLSELFDAQVTFVSPALAAHYGLDAPGPDGEVDLSSVAERGGLLTQGAIATVGGNTASMVSRGLYLLENVLCSRVGSPPAGVDTTPPATEPGSSQRTYSEDRVDNPSCGGCHTQFEPLAWGLERYDPTGVYALEDSFGNTLLQDGEVFFPGRTAAVSYSSTEELNTLLADSDEVKACLAEKSSQFAMGRPLAKSEDCSLEAIDASFLSSAGSYQDLMVAIALSPMFRRIRLEEGSP